MLFWADACKNAENRTLETLQIASRASSFVIVRRSPVINAVASAALFFLNLSCCILESLTAFQIAAYSVCLIASGTMLVLWRRIDERNRQRIWRLYGWYCGLMLCSSCFGIVRWTANLNFSLNFYEQNNIFKVNPTPDVMKAKAFSFLADAMRWGAISLVFSASEFMCLSAGKLLVLDRMSEFAMQGNLTVLKWLGRSVISVVVLGNSVGIASNIVAALYTTQFADRISEVSILYARNKSDDGSAAHKNALPIGQHALNISSSQLLCEVTVLLLILVIFLGIGVLCARRIRTRLIGVDTSSATAQAGSVLHLQVTVTTAIVFVAFLLHSVLSMMQALGFALSNFDQKCKGVASRCDPSCYNEYAHMFTWMEYTPEFSVIMLIISSPVALLVVLWGMTTKLALQLMKRRHIPQSATLL
jgi:hypothetical protein